MLYYFNYKKINNQILITNDFGRFAFLSEDEFKLLLHDKVDYCSTLGTMLQENLFIYSGSEQAFSADKAYLLRDSKNYLFSATGLHIFVVTTACNMNCVYCQANSGKSKLKDFMSEETAERAVDIALQSPNNYLSFEFQGGEPLLNYKVIKHIIEYTENNCNGKDVSFSVVSNLTLLNDDMIDFFKENNVNISTSLDGDIALHNKNRPYIDGRGTYEDLLNSVIKLRNAGVKVSAIQTTTRSSLERVKEIIDTYCEFGFFNVFIRPLTPLGCAKTRWAEIGYTAEEFSMFYQSALQYIVQKNKQGFQIQEGHATIVFSKLLHGFPVNYMELRSPCGASLGQMAYYSNGDIFTCDEGRMLSEMGNDSFKLGDVYRSQYSDLVCNNVCRASCISSVTESIPGCSDCVYQPFCGVCPVVNLALYNDVLAKTPHNYRCKVYKGIFDTLFKLLQTNDAETISILEGWRA